jgi:hypothetical protein
MILSAQIHSLGIAGRVAATLRKGASTGGEVGGDRSVGCNPVSERIFAILDDSLGSLISIICSTGLAGGDGCVVDKLEKVLSVTGDNSKLFAVFTESIELVGEGSLELLTSDVGELGLCDKRFGFSADQLLLENDDLGRVWLLVLELGNLIGDLLLSYPRD